MIQLYYNFFNIFYIDPCKFYYQLTFDFSAKSTHQNI